MNGKRRGALLTFGALISALAASSLAWACTQQALITLIPPFAPAGKTVTVKGERFAPGAPVEIRWNGTSGAILGIAEGPDFVTEITVPKDARPDVYLLVGIQRNVVDQFRQRVPELGATAPLGVLKAASPAGNEATGADINAISRATASDLWSGYEKGQGEGSSLRAASGGAVVASKGLAWGGGVLATAALGTLMWLLVFVRPRRSSSVN